MKILAKAFLILLCPVVQIATGAARVDIPRSDKAFDISLRIRANLYFGDESEEVSPVARTKFYLLEDDLVTILRQNGLNPVSDDGNNELLVEEADYLDAVANAFDSDDENGVLVSVLIRSAITERVAGKIETDSDGIGKTTFHKPGKLFLYGIHRVGSEILVWNLPIEIKPGINEMELDQHNAATLIASEK